MPGDPVLIFGVLGCPEGDFWGPLRVILGVPGSPQGDFWGCPGLFRVIPGSPQGDSRDALRMIPGVIPELPSG